jgi:hypothetical protein
MSERVRRPQRRKLKARCERCSLALGRGRRNRKLCLDCRNDQTYFFGLEAQRVVPKQETNPGCAL